MFKAFGTAVEKDALVPYLDYATPTMADTLGAALQDLLAKKATPEQFLDTVEKDYSGFVASNGDDGATDSTPGPPGEPARRIAYLYLLPAFLVYAAFLLYPLGRSVQISLYDWNGDTLATWAGLDNYADVVTDPALRARLRPRARAGVLLCRAAGGDRAGARVDPQPGEGAGAGVLPHRGLPPPGRGDGRHRRRVAADVRPGRQRQRPAPGRRAGVADPGLAGGLHCAALPAVGFIGTWFEIGLVTVLLLAGMGRIPGELYEAARLDGAGPVREFFAVTLPSVRGEISVALTLTVIAALRTFDLVYVTTRGGPGQSTSVPSFEVYNRAFQQGRVGSAAAIAVVLTLIIFAISFGITRVADRDAR